MNQKSAWQRFSKLPPEAQKQVMDFMAFLQEQYAPVRPRKFARHKLTKEPFVGMWRNRTDLKDSTVWVRGLRTREWTTRRG